MIPELKTDGLKLIVLVDNNTLTRIDADLRGEPGLSYYIECDGTKILFDTGYSDLFIENAFKMLIGLQDVEYIILSHGHCDHTWGLVSLIQLHTRWAIQGLPYISPVLVAHPDIFLPKVMDETMQIGSLVTKEEMSRYADVRFSTSPVWITDKLVYLGEIERINEFEGSQPIGKTEKNHVLVDDYMLEDTALAYKSEIGLVIITGCSHSGICNVIDYAKKVCHESRIADVIGGFHLQDPSMKQLEGTLKYFQDLHPGSLHPCHCTDLKSKIYLSRCVKIEEVGVGLTLRYE